MVVLNVVRIWALLHLFGPCHDGEWWRLSNGLEDGIEGANQNETTNVDLEMLELSTCPTTNTTNSGKTYRSKKRFRSDDGFNELATKIHEFVGAYKDVVTYFKKEFGSTDRKMKIFEEIMQLHGLSRKDVMVNIFWRMHIRLAHSLLCQRILGGIMWWSSWMTSIHINWALIFKIDRMFKP